MFCTKWKAIEADFVAYFEAQWLGIHCNWFEGAAVHAPPTNYALEAVNGVIKRKVTLRKRLPMNQLVSSMVKLISEYSTELSDGSREFAKESSVGLKLWADAILMYQNSFKSFKLKPIASHPNHISFTVPSSKCLDPSVAYYKTIAGQKWKSFDEYMYKTRVSPVLFNSHKTIE